MMNFVAIAFLISYLSGVVVFVPEPQLTRADLFGSDGAAQNGPSSVDQVKDTLHKGYEKTAEGIDRAKEGAKETVQGVYEQSKHGVQDNAQWAKQGIQDGAYESAQAVQEKAGQAKQGVYDAAQYATDGLRDKAEQVRQGVQEAPEKVASYIPSKEEAMSHIPGTETGREAVNMVKQKAFEVKESISLNTLRSRLDELRRDAAQYMTGKEKEPSYSSYADLKRKLDEASAYIPGMEAAGAYVPGMDSIENMRRGVQETAQGVQGKISDAGESARDATNKGAQGLYDKSRNVADSARDTTASYREAGEGYKGKVGGMFQGMKDRFGGGAKGRRGGAPLERRVQELCMWYGDGSESARACRGGAPPISLDVAATRQSYGYLMQSALGAIDGAREVFDHAISGNAGGEWREKFAYLSDSSKGALEASTEVFDRVASAAEGTLQPGWTPSQKGSGFGSGSEKNMTKLGAVAACTKATMRQLTRALYLATFSAVYGLTLWTTFLYGRLLSRTLPPQQLGIVQSKLFPVYLRIITGCIAVCGAIHVLLHPWRSADRPEHWQYLNIAVCIAAGLLNMFLVEPRATKMMVEKLKVEKEEGRGQSGGQEMITDEKLQTSINTKLKGYHRMASYLNLAIVAGLTWHLWYLANRLVV